MNLGETFDQSSDPSRKLFQCAMCNKFTTDALDLLGLHLNAERALPEEEWKGAVGEAYQCRLCHYSTQLKANFQLHCKTEKHLQKYQLVAHIREGGKANEWRLKCMVIGNPLHLKCNACDYYTNSLEKLRLHTGNYRHEASLKLYKVRRQGGHGGQGLLGVGSSPAGATPRPCLLRPLLPPRPMRPIAGQPSPSSAGSVSSCSSLSPPPPSSPRLEQRVLPVVWQNRSRRLY